MYILKDHTFFKKICLFIHSERAKREAETQVEGEAGCVQEARCGTRSWVSRITPQAAGGTKALRHRGCPIYLFLKIYLFMRDTERQAPCREPDMGLDPGTPGPRPGPKADAQPVNHPGIPKLGFLKKILFIHETHRKAETQVHR